MHPTALSVPICITYLAYLILLAIATAAYAGAWGAAVSSLLEHLAFPTRRAHTRCILAHSCIGATTLEEYKLIEKGAFLPFALTMRTDLLTHACNFAADEAFARRMQVSRARWHRRGQCNAPTQAPPARSPSSSKSPTSPQPCRSSAASSRSTSHTTA